MIKQMSLAQTMDKVGFEIFAKRQPDVITAINAALDNGDTAAKIEKALFKRFGTMSLTAALAAGAAHYLEGHRRNRANVIPFDGSLPDDSGDELTEEARLGLPVEW